MAGRLHEMIPRHYTHQQEDEELVLELKGYLAFHSYCIEYNQRSRSVSHIRELRAAHAPIMANTAPINKALPSHVMTR
jgi:hypothetical protein